MSEDVEDESIDVEIDVEGRVLDAQETDQQRSLKAALLLARIILANAVEEDFDFIENNLLVDEHGMLLIYENVALRLVDVLSGGLMLIRGLVQDIAESEDLHPAEIARVMEISTAMAEAIGTVEQPD